MELFIVFYAKLCRFQNAYQHACFINETKTTQRYNTRIIGIQWRFFYLYICILYKHLYRSKPGQDPQDYNNIIYIVYNINSTYICTSRGAITPQFACIIYHNILHVICIRHTCVCITIHYNVVMYNNIKV